MKIENVEVHGWKSAFRAMRNPRDSWAKGDSSFENGIFIGAADLTLSCKLVRGGFEHRKFLRQIIIWADLVLPRYVLQELDTYKVATVRNSCSTMNKLGTQDLSEEDFQDGDVLPEVLAALNRAGWAYRNKAEFITSKARYTSYDIVRWMKRNLPEGFLQRITYTMSYETALSMLLQRSSHRLPEWSGPTGICAWLRTLPCLHTWYEALTKQRKDS